MLVVLGVLRWAYPLEYVDIIRLEAWEKGLDPYLVAAVLRVESRFDPEAVSPKGARGLMQLMPETAQWVAKQAGVKYHPDKLFDPGYNIKLGTWYLSDLLHEFNGNIWLALAAYNGGRGNVRQWLASRRWLGDVETLHKIPFAETRRFVQKVRITWIVYNNLYPFL
ncbi:MAG: lytic transglycosylase domain-containing protein [Bacillota bacterium]